MNHRQWTIFTYVADCLFFKVFSYIANTIFKNLMKNKMLICLSLFVAITISGCFKKADDDPLISLRSRKARVDGEWKVASATQTEIYTASGSGGSYTKVYTGTGNTYTFVSTVNGVSTKETGVVTQEWEFDKEGTYKTSDNTDGVITTTEGRWNFTSSIGETKNKSQIALSKETETNGASQDVYTGNYVDEVYDIKELRNDKMVLYSHRTVKDANGTSDIETQIELEAKD